MTSGSGFNSHDPRCGPDRHCREKPSPGTTGKRIRPERMTLECVFCTGHQTYVTADLFPLVSTVTVALVVAPSSPTKISVPVPAPEIFPITPAAMISSALGKFLPSTKTRLIPSEASLNPVLSDTVTLVALLAVRLAVVCRCCSACGTFRSVWPAAREQVRELRSSLRRVQRCSTTS